MLRQEIEQYIASNPYGWCTVAKACEMADLITHVRPTVCVEIGVYGGRSLIPQAIALRELGYGVIVGIDPWSSEAATEGTSDPQNEEWWRQQNFGAIRGYTEESIRRLGLERHCITLPWRSENAQLLFQPHSIDILHIDGNHTELASVRDVNTWFPRMKPGGHIWFDDINWSTTQKALSLLDGCCERVKDVICENTNVRLYRVKCGTSLP